MMQTVGVDDHERDDSRRFDGCELGVAADLSLLSSFVYSPEQEFVDKVQQHFGDVWKVYFDEQGSCECAVMVHEPHGLCYIVFRGTEKTEWGDIRADLNVDLVRDPPHLPRIVRVHEGFQKELDKCWENLVGHLLTIPSWFRVYTTGHSLGGALATLCAARMSKSHHLRSFHTACYSFGSPMVGSFAFSTLDFNHFRVRNNNDKVCNIYTQHMLGYTHHGTQVYINSNGQIRDKLSKWQRFKDWFRGHLRALQKWEWFDSIRDHGIDRYIQAFSRFRRTK